MSSASDSTNKDDMEWRLALFNPFPCESFLPISSSLSFSIDNDDIFPCVFLSFVTTGGGLRSYNDAAIVQSLFIEYVSTDRRR